MTAITVEQRRAAVIDARDGARRTASEIAELFDHVAMQGQGDLFSTADGVHLAFVEWSRICVACTAELKRIGSPGHG